MIARQVLRALCSMILGFHQELKLGSGCLMVLCFRLRILGVGVCFSFPVLLRNLLLDVLSRRDVSSVFHSHALGAPRSTFLELSVINFTGSGPLWFPNLYVLAFICGGVPMRLLAASMRLISRIASVKLL